MKTSTKITRSPIFAYSGWVISIIGLIFSLYSYISSIKEKDPYFVSNTYNEPIIRKSYLGDTSGFALKIVHQNGDIPTEISGDLYAKRIHFWNNGKDSIKRENILEALKIIPQTNSKIIGFRILKVSRPQIIGLSYDLNLQENFVNFDFSILEKDDGFTAQILYIGDENAQFKLAGTIESVEHINSTNQMGQIGTFSVGILGIVFLLLAIAIFFFIISRALHYIIKHTVLYFYLRFKSQRVRTFYLKFKNDFSDIAFNILMIPIVIFALYSAINSLKVTSVSIPDSIRINHVNGE